MKNLITIAVLFAALFPPFGGIEGGCQNVGINIANPDPSALLELTSDSMGLLIPRMTTDQRNAIDVSVSPNSVMIFNTTTKCFEFYYDGSWYELGCVCEDPAAAGTITGTTPVCQSQNGVAYSVGAITGATGYVWNYTGTGFTIATGDSTESITADFSGSATSGDLTVYGTNECGNGTASPAYSITVNAAPSITAHPSDLCIIVGSNADFSVTASGATSYQWQENDGGGWSDITTGGGGNPGYSGYTTATLTLTNIPLSYEGYDYLCVVTNSCGNVNSNSANLSVSPATVQDPDSYTYNVIGIGAQCWLAEDLRYDGDPGGAGCTGVGWVNNTDVGWCGYYSGGPYANEGLLYQWSAAMNSSTTPGAQGLCPTGWHIPTDAEYCTLEQQICSDIGNAGCATTFDCVNTLWLGQSTTTAEGEGSAMAGYEAKWTNGNLDHNGAGDNDFGTSGLIVPPSGYRYYGDGSYNLRSDHASLWSSTESGGNAWKRRLNYTGTQVSRYTDNKPYGFTVRCLKD